MSAGVIDNPGLAVPKHGRAETDEEFDDRYERYFNRKEIDGWEIRKALTDLQGMDLIPEPRILIAALKACRRNNDLAMCIRMLEAVKWKCHGKKEIWGYIMQEIKPTMDELGVPTLEELGYDRPELATVNPFDIHG
jgi:cytochrome c oxidase subunit 5a